MKSGRSMVNLAQELQRQLRRSGIWSCRRRCCNAIPTKGGELKMIVDTKAGDGEYGVTDLARRQLAEKLKIPFAYFERMRTEQPGLLDRNVNTWLQTDSERRMIRTLDGQVRAVLSDRYRRLDNFDLAENVLPILQRLDGARFESVELTETKMYLKVVTPRVEFEIAPGDVVQAGIVITNSEVGTARCRCSRWCIRLDMQQRADRVGPCIAQDARRAHAAIGTRRRSPSSGTIRWRQTTRRSS
jgi:hypothetical protein